VTGGYAEIGIGFRRTLAACSQLTAVATGATVKTIASHHIARTMRESSRPTLAQQAESFKGAQGGKCQISENSFGFSELLELILRRAR